MSQARATSCSTAIRSTVRLSHWLNVLCIAILVMSGLQIFNAHPRLYWGDTGNEGDPAIFEIYAEEQLEGPPIGWTKIGNIDLQHDRRSRRLHRCRRIFLGPRVPVLDHAAEHSESRRRAPLALLFRLAVRHQRLHLSRLRFRATAIFSATSRPRARISRRIGRTILDHLKFKRARGEEAKRYNVLQKLTYIVVIFVLLPLMIVTGLSMSPGVEFRHALAAGALRRAPIGAHASISSPVADRRSSSSCTFSRCSSPASSTRCAR